MFINTFLAAAEVAAVNNSQNIKSTVVIIGISVVFFYFILWRPEQKKRKQMEELRRSLKKGDKVIAMGIKAVVDEVREKTVVLKQIDGAKIEMLTGAISTIEAKESPIVQS